MGGLWTQEGNVPLFLLMLTISRGVQSLKGRGFSTDLVLSDANSNPVWIVVFQPVIRIYDIPDNTFSSDDDDDDDDEDEDEDEDDDDDNGKYSAKKILAVYNVLSFWI